MKRLFFCRLFGGKQLQEGWTMYAVSGFLIVIVVLCLCVYWPWHQSASKVLVVIEEDVFVNGTASIAETDRDFICATLDYGPSDHCDHGFCWGKATLFDLVSILSTDTDFTTMEIWNFHLPRCYLVGSFWLLVNFRFSRKIGKQFSEVFFLEDQIMIVKVKTVSEIFEENK